jgi:hypothetical protein
MSSNDDDRPDQDSLEQRGARITPDRQWVLRPNQAGAAAADASEREAADAATPAPPVPPPGAPGTTGPTPPSGRQADGPPPTTRPTIDAPQTEAQGTPVTPAPAAPPAPPATGPVQSWGSRPGAPVAPEAPARPAHIAPTPTQLGGAADPPTLTPADSPTATTPVARSTSPTNVTLGPAQRNVVPPQAASAPQAQPAQAQPQAQQPQQGQQPQPRPAAAAAPGPRPTKGGPTFADLAQQLAATQAQVAALSAQLTTLAHRLTYDVERGAQTTSERVTRDLERTLAEAVALRVGAHLGPAVDDLTDQIAEDFTPKLEAAAEQVRRLTEVGLDQRISALTDAVDSLPMGNVEVLGQLDTLGSDLQDRLQRFSTRLLDQVGTLERSNVSELTRLREAIDELKAAGTSSGGGADVETLRRIANHVERLAQRTPGTAGIVAAVETLITEHLDSVRTGLEEQVAALAPTVQVELDAVRAENLQALGSIEHELLEQISTIEASMVERLDGMLADHLDSVDAVIADRQEGIVEAVATAGGERVDEAVTSLTDVGAARLEEVAAVANLGADRMEELTAAVQELQTTIAEGGLGAEPVAVGDDAVSAIEALMSTVVEELQALRKKITESASTGISEAEIESIASAVIKQIRNERAEAQSEATHLAKPRRGRG